MSKKKANLIVSNKLKFRKPRKSISNVSKTHLTFKHTTPYIGHYVIQAVSSGLITKNQLESARIVAKRRIKGNNGSVWVLVKPVQIVTKRALETRMGRGKGAPHHQILVITKGQILLGMQGLPLSRMLMVFNKMKEKLSVKTKLIKFSFNID